MVTNARGLVESTKAKTGRSGSWEWVSIPCLVSIVGSQPFPETYVE